VNNDYGTEIRGLGPEWAARAIGKNIIVYESNFY
jgi:hypothetical protein